MKKSVLFVILLRPEESLLDTTQRDSTAHLEKNDPVVVAYFFGGQFSPCSGLFSAYTRYVAEKITTSEKTFESSRRSSTFFKKINL